MVTRAKQRDTRDGLPLLVDPVLAMRTLNIGRSSLDELERGGLLRRVRVGSLRVVRYRRSDVLAVAGVIDAELSS